MFPGTEFGAHRNGLLLLATSKTLFTFSGHSTDLQAEVAATFSRVSIPESPFPSRVVLAFLRVVLDRNEDVVGRFERELARLEEVPVRESRSDSLERTFRLKKELSAAQSDLWRLKGLLAALAENRATLPGIGAEARELFLGGLVNDAEYLYETVVNTREGLLSLIDLHLNVVSFEMNRVMRVLAVVSVLGLIPAVIGGLLGMNLVDNPWPATLPQIAWSSPAFPRSRWEACVVGTRHSSDLDVWTREPASRAGDAGRGSRNGNSSWMWPRAGHTHKTFITNGL
jgi:Mg2+ and Co2+ transporter CorA